MARDDRWSCCSAEASERLKESCFDTYALPWVKVLLGDRGYDADWFRAALAGRKIAACIQSKVTARCQSHMTSRSTASA